MESDEIQFVSTQRNQQKLVYRGRCYTLKRTNRNDKCWICASGTRGCPGKLYTNLDATQGCRVDAHAFYHQQQLNELKRLAAEDQSIACNLSECSQSQKGVGVWKM
ncbi:hypothetical protein T06_4163, partial [Trichinella sp. T6]